MGLQLLAILAIAALAAAAPPPTAPPGTPSDAEAAPTPKTRRGRPDATTAGAAVPARKGKVAVVPLPPPKPQAQCAKPCYTVADYWPYKTCKAECSPEICKQGWGVWQSEELCCEAGAAFTDGCRVRPKECWVAESAVTRTCRRDDRKCLQGYGVWPSEEACCLAGSAFPDGCLPPPANGNRTCWVVDTYFPARLCRETRNLCSPGTGIQSWPSREACCAQGGAFAEGCSRAPPPTPCYMVGSYWPKRTCVVSEDVAVCNRGWGVYSSEEVCCTPNVAFSEGCSPSTATDEPSASKQKKPAGGAAATIVPTPSRIK